MSTTSHHSLYDGVLDDRYHTFYCVDNLTETPLSRPERFYFGSANLVTGFPLTCAAIYAVSHIPEPTVAAIATVGTGISYVVSTIARNMRDRYSTEHHKGIDFDFARFCIKNAGGPEITVKRSITEGVKLGALRNNGLAQFVRAGYLICVGVATAAVAACVAAKDFVEDTCCYAQGKEAKDRGRNYDPGQAIWDAIPKPYRAVREHLESIHALDPLILAKRAVARTTAPACDAR